MRKTLLLIFLGLVTVLSYGQKSTLQLHSALTGEEDRSHGFALTYALNGSHVETRRGAYDIIFPKNFNASDTAFAVEYFIGYPGEAERGIPILIANYKSAFPSFHIDYNNNLDFSDDGEALQFDEEDSSAVLVFRNKKNPDARFAIKYFRGKTSEESDRELDKILGTASLRENGIPILPPKFWFYTKRHNNRIALATLDGDSVKVALHDYNCNGYFNDAGEDLIFIAPPHIPFTARKSSGAFVYKTDSALFAVNDRIYEVMEVDSLGRSIKVKLSDLPFDPPLAPGRKMPDLSFDLVDGGDSSLADFLSGQNYLLIDCWGAWCKGCHSSAKAISELQRKYPQKLQILGLNTGEPREKILEFTEKYGHSWTQGMLSPEIRKTFMVDGYPTFILIEPSGTIFSLQSHPGEVEEVLAGSK